MSSEANIASPYTEDELAWLKGDEFKASGLTYDQLKVVFDREALKVLAKRPGLKGTALVQATMDTFVGVIRKMVGGGLTLGKGVAWGATPLNNYVAGWAEKQKKEYRAAKKKNDGSERALIGKTVEIRVGPDGKEELVALDTRANYKTGRENPNYLSPLPHSSYMSNIIAVWKNSIDGKLYLVDSTVGGEMRDSDWIISPECPVCHKKGYDARCKSTIVSKGEQIPCPGVRRSLIPDIMSNSGKLGSFSLKIKKKEEKGKVVSIEVSWTDDTLIGKSKPFDFERAEDGSIKFAENGLPVGPIMDWIPKNRLLTGSKAVQFWEQFGKGGKVPVVFWYCQIYDMQEKANDDGTRFFWAYDKSMGLNKGIKLVIPDHVYEYCVRGKFGEQSKVIVAGHINRRNKYDNKTGKSIEGQWNDPQIDVSCIVPVVAVIPETTGQQLDAVEAAEGSTEEIGSANTEIEDAIAEAASGNVDAPVDSVEHPVPVPAATPDTITPIAQEQTMEAVEEEETGLVPTAEDPGEDFDDSQTEKPAAAKPIKAPAKPAPAKPAKPSGKKKAAEKPAAQKPAAGPEGWFQ